jgi:hypothetical protein
VTSTALSSILNPYLQTLTVGSVSTTTVSSSSSASASLSIGSVTNNTQPLSFSFFIPRGEKGDKGDKGDTGDRGEQGEQGPAGADGADGSSASGLDILGLLGVGLSVANFAATITAVGVLQTEMAVVQGQVTTLQAAQAADEVEIGILQNKTLYQTSLTPAIDGRNATRFTSQLRLNDGLSDNVLFDPAGSNSISNPTTMSRDLTLTGCDFKGSGLNNCEIGSLAGLTNISLNGSIVSINSPGFSINGLPYYSSSSFFNQASGFFQQI